ncbi:acyl carrier protein [Solwaraspora sp. WMMD406]|uniref:acyl carrier protein n=1 Tax=Solwaraspora sp. WMMD406 TaxID=3016095 RepID=UPI002416442D|nr:acyl carrier protein [Solwaraspora sp. WMMD406]MDG4765028.1 acyl carrier protein [Solwaraspora sp. WMMD406]
MTLDASWYQKLADTPFSERASALEALVVAEFKTWLLMGDAETLPLDESYFELGLTSLGATEIQQLLVAGFGRPIDAVSLFNNPTVGHLLEYLRAEVLRELFVQGGAAPIHGTPAPAEQRYPGISTSSDAGVTTKDLVDDILAKLYNS